MRERILTFIRDCPDPFSKDIRYHKKCWQDNVRNSYKSSEYIHCQNVQQAEVKELFFRHVNNFIIENNEPRLLSGLLVDFNNLLNNYNLEKIKTSSWLKEMLEKEFGDCIGFHQRFHSNQSTIVYNTSGGGDFIEAAINAWGIDDETLIRNTSKSLHEMFHKHVPFQWPPDKSSMDEIVKPPELLMKFVKWLSAPGKSNIDDEAFDPSDVMLADLLLSCITRKRTCMKVIIFPPIFFNN